MTSRCTANEPPWPERDFRCGVTDPRYGAEAAGAAPEPALGG
ncbi:hypothetical protein [Streptomyces lincolnensis]|nr:hypothetical protein [Streptomyces lincolnensis]